jgi:putative CocE/NonD family hydrolase
MDCYQSGVVTADPVLEKCVAMCKAKLFSLITLTVLLMAPAPPSGSRAGAIDLLDVSSHLIEVPAGSFNSEETVTLAATLYQPRFFFSAPAVIYIHGWGGGRLLGSDNPAAYVAAAGYIVLSYSARGFGEGESGGRVTIAGPDELNDLSRVIDWLINDPDRVIGPRVGKIGVIGGSYGGGHSFQISSDPRVSAVIPLVGWTDLEQSLFPNGAINYRLGLAEFYEGLNRQVGQAPFYNYDRLQFELFDTAAEGRAPGNNLRRSLGARSIAHQDGDGREILEESRQPRAAVFIIQSWDDYLFPATQVLEVFSQITAPKQIYLGRSGHPPGGHTFEGEEFYIGAQALRWFDHHLRGIGGTDGRSIVSAPAPAPFSFSLFATRELPSDETALNSLFLKSNGILSRKKKGQASQETAGGIFRPGRIRSSYLGAEIPPESDMFSGSADQLPTSPRQLVYTFGPWETDTEMIGPSEFSLFVSSGTSTNLDVVVRTSDVAPDGGEAEVTVGAMRVNGLLPNEVRRVTFRDFGDHWIFRAGHSLRLRVANIDFPTFRPPGGNDNIASEITIHSGKRLPSRIRLQLRTR